MIWSSKDDEDNASSTSSSVDNGIDQTKVKSENLSCSKIDGMKYNRMNAAKTTILETPFDGAPEDMKFIGYKDIEEYTKKSYVECTVFKVAVYEDKYGIRVLSSKGQEGCSSSEFECHTFNTLHS